MNTENILWFETSAEKRTKTRGFLASAIALRRESLRIDGAPVVLTPRLEHISTEREAPLHPIGDTHGNLGMPLATVGLSGHCNIKMELCCVKRIAIPGLLNTLKCSDGRLYIRPDTAVCSYFIFIIARVTKLNSNLDSHSKK